MDHKISDLTIADLRCVIEDVAGLAAICVLFIAGLGLPLWT